jgi:hypothetical protein
VIHLRGGRVGHGPDVNVDVFLCTSQHVQGGNLTLIQCDHVHFPVLEQLPGFDEEWCTPPSPDDISTPDPLSNGRAETMMRVLAVVLVVSLVP